MADSYSKEIGQYAEMLRKFRKSRELFQMENELLELEQTRYKLINYEIHRVLVKKKNAKSEEQIRALIRDIINLDLPVVEAKINRFSDTLGRLQNNHKSDENQINNCYRFLNEWLNLHENFWALASFRSLEHFVQFMEIDVKDENKKVWKNSLDPYKDNGYTGVNKPFFQYFNQMVMKKNIKFISKQYPTGYGKCVKADTPVLTKSGYVPISDVQVGDYVASMKDNALVYRKVTNKWNTRKKQVKITTCSGKEIVISPEHRMYTSNGYQCAENLTVTDYLYRFCSENEFNWEEIKSIERIEELCDMVDIEVEETHNFIANGLVSHNSYSNQVAIAWLMGVDVENDVLLVVGNPALVSQNANGIVSIMTNPRFARVFPDFARFFNDGDVTNQMYNICRIKQGEIAINGSARPLNIKIISKDTPIDGIRVKFLFLDDVCRSKDANNLKAHEEDIDNYWNSWYKRNYGTDDFYIIVGGTAYSVEDILSYLIRYYSNGKMTRTPTNKYTYISENGDCVFIKIPKIDDDLNRSTYPQKFPYAEAVKARERNYRMFMAMEQQQPLNPESCPFAWENLNTYEKLPDNLSDYSVALIDPARCGQNYVSMAIFRVREEKDQFNAVNKVYYLVDCIYRLKRMEDVYEEICEKVEKHHIVKLQIENNTDTSLKNLLDKMFHEKHLLFCETMEFFTYENKETKLKELTYKYWGYLVNQIRFPCFSMYPPAHQMGKFMQHITCYNFRGKNDYDDSIDTVCMFIERFLVSEIRPNRAKILRV